MDARLLRAALLVGLVASLGASHRTANFVVNAPTPEIARQVGTAAEEFRQTLAIEWLGKPMPTWSQPCPITVEIGAQLGAGGATSFVFDHGEVFGWQMNIQGPLDRVLDSVLPHEVTHTIIASHFRRPLPRWADEGACTTVEHHEERAKQQKMLVTFLRTGRGIPFSQMFAMKDYPRDILPLYAQGHSLATFLLAQGGKQKFLAFVADGLERDQWTQALNQHYGFTNLAVLQDTWLDWVRHGSPALPATGPSNGMIAANDRPSNDVIVRGQSADPVMPPLAEAPRPAPGEIASNADVGWRASAAHNQPAAAQSPAVVAPVQPRSVIVEWSADARATSVYAPRTGDQVRRKPALD
jgi:hypothetical protein